MVLVTGQWLVSQAQAWATMAPTQESILDDSD